MSPPSSLLLPQHLTPQNSYVSFDPYQRGRMRDASINSYVPVYELGSVITNTGIATVYKSKKADFKEGEIVTGNLGLENYSVVAKEQLAGFQKVDNKYNLPLSNYTGALGMPGLSA